ncbi:hypothetical protein LTR27_008701 [Elasticomyces elasticus]|nr:hypothetical protein LTR27_008701 [Elasticomyces elasticus]
MASSPRPPDAPMSPDQVLSAEDIAFAACGKESLRGFGIRPSVLEYELVPWMLLETNVREFHARRNESGLPALVCADKQWVEYQRVRAEQEQHFTSITPWQSCLSKALNNFNASGAKLSVAFDEQDCAICWANRDTHCSTAHGEIRLGHAVRWDYCFDKVPTGKQVRPANALYRILASGCGVTQVTMSQRWMCVSIELFAIPKFQAACRDMKTCASLERLELALQGPDELTAETSQVAGFECEYRGTDAYRQGLTDFLNHCPNLKHLTLRRYSEGCPNMGTANFLIRNLDLPNLHTLELVNWQPGPDSRLSFEELSCFFNHHKVTIRRFSLSYGHEHLPTDAEDEEAQKLYVSALATGLVLESFEMFRISYVHTPIAAEKMLHALPSVSEDDVALLNIDRGVSYGEFSRHERRFYPAFKLPSPDGEESDDDNVLDE